MVLTGKLYGNVDFIDERHRHRFEVVFFIYFFYIFHVCYILPEVLT